MNLMEIVRSYELAEEGTIGIVAEWHVLLIQCYVNSEHTARND
jgi:hypothetical protein